MNRNLFAAESLVKIAKELLAEDKEDLLTVPYKTKNSIHNFIHKLVDRKVGGLHRDSAWEDVSEVWNELEKNGIHPEVSVEDGGYSIDGNSKTYKFSFSVRDSQGKELPISGQLCCFAAGTVEDPWKAYDMTFQIF